MKPGVLDYSISRRTFLKAAGAGLGTVFACKLLFKEELIKKVLAQTNPTLAVLQLGTCAGCQVSLANFGMDMSTGTSDPTFADVLSSFEIVYHPLLTDKLEEDFLALTQVDICVVEGIAGDTVVATELLEHARNISTLLITMGDCASYGGVPGLNATKGLLNLYPVDQYVMSDGSLLQVDIKIPGCPPQPEHIVYVLTAGAMGEAILDGEVCDACIYDSGGARANELGEPGCKRDLGCKGDLTGTDRTTRICATSRSTGGVSPCTACDDVCLGCYEEVFPSTPFYELQLRRCKKYGYCRDKPNHPN